MTERERERNRYIHTLIERNIQKDRERVRKTQRVIEIFNPLH